MQYSVNNQHARPKKVDFCSQTYHVISERGIRFPSASKSREGVEHSWTAEADKCNHDELSLWRRIPWEAEERSILHLVGKVGGVEVDDLFGWGRCINGCLRNRLILLVGHIGEKAMPCFEAKTNNRMNINGVEKNVTSPSRRLQDGTRTVRLTIRFRTLQCCCRSCR